ncbi:bifunctional tRNA (5-methylaminomethyl-2-thiouridine)(34)-methyltransferase MnmD/FAD-dependent 5-carboxymethylaminomethyl-2-thiouridine(34) oxidoreductase MnmC [Thalassotalea maritima]|uniref:bifunctional tRNA (5-methylaminomethyl-2-thiouridine)(34)-methyltransferase MnmD/FAD-dependent 5-carboxymethylaminomethyl-2-thiouridine(34) oxidoreductase MnmC n=1 Tax=Thalassotalea maritima TaxID=3242416 RepID=UPI003528ED63
MVNIKTADVKFDQHGAPYSEQFDDIYFDSKQGWRQSEQVFIENNQLPSRWHNFNKPCFTIAETGFGSGLNFFLTAKAFTEFYQQHDSNLSLHFISVEKYPMTLADISKVLALWPELSHWTEQFIAQYHLEKPVLEMHFGDNIRLTIYLDDALKSYRALADVARQSVDAFYLDGFAPKRNTDMWSETLFAEFARLAAPKATLGTFTVAGFVRRDLENQGFNVTKRKHSSSVQQGSVSPSESSNTQVGKRESLQAEYVGIKRAKPLTGFKVRSKTEASQHATIIGGGIASACMALALVKKGIKTTIYCKDATLAQGASSNAIGAVYPLLHVETDTISRFYQQSFDYAIALYQQLLSQDYQFSHGFDGLIEVAYKAPLIKRQQKFENSNHWPYDLIHGVNAEQASELANISLPFGGLFMPRAGWVSPPELVQAVCQAAEDSGLLTVKYQRHLQSVVATDNGRWRFTTNKEAKTVQNLIFCTGADSLNIDILNDLPLSAVRGQVTQMQSNEHIAPLKAVLCHKGYLTPAHQGVHCIGATFDKNNQSIEATAHDDIFNLNMLTTCLGDIAKWQADDIVTAKARLRCCTPDHLPIASRMPIIDKHIEYYEHLRYDKNWHFEQAAPLKHGLYVLTGLGARGLCSAPLLAEIIACEITGQDYPVDDEMLFNLSANRFIVRDLIRSTA